MLYDIRKINDKYMDIRIQSYIVSLVDTETGSEIAWVNAKDKTARINKTLNNQEKSAVIEFLSRWNVVKKSELEVHDKIKLMNSIIAMRSYGRYIINY